MRAHGLYTLELETGGRLSTPCGHAPRVVVISLTPCCCDVFPSLGTSGTGNGLSFPRADLGLWTSWLVDCYSIITQAHLPSALRPTSLPHRGFRAISGASSHLQLLGWCFEEPLSLTLGLESGCRQRLCCAPAVLYGLSGWGARCPGLVSSRPLG